MHYSMLDQAYCECYHPHRMQGFHADIRKGDAREQQFSQGSYKAGTVNWCS